MSYMELKRRHQDLISEVATLEGKSREQDEKYLVQIDQFTEEIKQSRVSITHVFSLCHDPSSYIIMYFRRPT